MSQKAFLPQTNTLFELFILNIIDRITMVISVRDPFSGQLMNLRAKEEDDGEQQHNWRIYFPYKFSFLMTWRDNEWKVVDDVNIHPALIRELGDFLRTVICTTEDYKETLIESAQRNLIKRLN